MQVARSLSSNDVLRIWEWSAPRNRAGRRTALLTAAVGADEEAVDGLTVGEQHSALLRVLRALCGPSIELVTECDQCGETLELPVELDALLSHTERPGRAEGSVEIEGRSHPVRALLGRDLRDATSCAEADQARRFLARRAITPLLPEPEAAPELTLGDADLDQISRELSEVDPGADIVVSATCPLCDSALSASVDPVALAFSEAERIALRRLADVHRLARAYGWREADVLEMSPVRRAAYLAWLDT